MLAVCVYNCQVGVDELIAIFDSTTGEIINTIILEAFEYQHLSAVEWSPDERQLAIGLDDGTFYIYELATNKIIATSNLSEYGITSLIWHPQGNLLALSSSDVISIWNIQTSAYEFSITNEHEVRDLAWLNENQLIFRDYTAIKTWTLGTDEIATLADMARGRYMAWNSDYTEFISLVDGYLLEVGDVKTGTILYKLDKHNSSANVVSWSPDGNLLAVAYRDPTLLILVDALSKETVAVLKNSNPLPIQIKWSLDSQKLIVSYSYEPLIDIWDFSKDKQAPTQTIEFQKRVIDIALSPDDKQLLVIELTDVSEVATNVSIINLESGQVEIPSVGGLNRAYVASWGSNNNRIGFFTIEEEFKIWDVATDTIIETIALDQSNLYATYLVSWNFDGEYFAGVSCPVSFRCHVWLWDTATEKLETIVKTNTEELPPRVINAFSWHPQENILAIAIDKQLYLYDVANETLQFVNEANDTIYSVSWHPNGQQIAVASDDGTIRIWDIEAQ